jgi:hypothetical protein
VKSSKIELNYKFSSAPKLINQGIALGGTCNSAVKIDFLHNIKHWVATGSETPPSLGILNALKMRGGGGVGDPAEH